MASEVMTTFRECRIRRFPCRLVADVQKLCIEEHIDTFLESF